MQTKKYARAKLTLAADTRTPLSKSKPITPPQLSSFSAIECSKSNIAMDGQKRSEKWWRSTSLLRSVDIGMCCTWLYSIGITVGRRPAFTGLFVDHARLWAEPQATRLIFLPVPRNKQVLRICYSKAVVDPGGPRDATFSVQFLSLFCSFWQTFCWITGRHPPSQKSTSQWHQRS